jgi:hypothetical protein
VLGVEPAAEAISLRFIGGDSFIELTVDAGHGVTVTGYRGEPYRWFLNDDRFGRGPLPAEVDPEAEPEWERVATGGRYAWHDHRATG